MSGPLRTGTVLDRIAAATLRRVAAAKERVPPAELRARALSGRRPLDFAAALRSPGLRVIAEVKLASPSEGDLGGGIEPVAAARDYAAHGAAALSVLTEPDFFKGSLDHLAAVRRETDLPLLMKDFILEEYQLWQARAHGADAALLIAALLGEDALAELIGRALALGLTPLVEVHTQEEMAVALRRGGRLIGINNRDLKTLRVDLEVSRRLAPLARMAGATLVSESGIGSLSDLKELSGLGFHAFLVGTSLMRGGRPGAALAGLLGHGEDPR